MKSEFMQISTTCDRQEILEQIAAKLVAARTAACCQLEGPVTSIYRWEGKTESASEYRLLIKTTTELFSAVEASVIELHSYQQPQITAVPIVAASEGYASWVRDNVGGA